MTLVRTVLEYWIAEASLAGGRGQRLSCAPSTPAGCPAVPATVPKPMTRACSAIVAMVFIAPGFFALCARADERQASVVVNDVSDEVDLPADDDEMLDELVVVGTPSLVRLKHMVYRAEESFFATFNELNDDDEYDVRCFYETPTGSRIRRHVCRANFVPEAESAEYFSWRFGAAAGGQEARTVIMSKRRRLEEKIMALLMANPKLADALANYHEARTQYDAEREKQCDGRIAACRR